MSRYTGYVKHCPPTGICTIYFDKVVRDWNEKWFITQWLPIEFRLCNEMGLKVTISPKIASKIIKTLQLRHTRSSFKSGVTWITDK